MNDETTATPDATETTETTTASEETETITRSHRPWSWHAVRALGVVLAVLLTVHFVVNFIGTDVARTTAGSMTIRWDNRLWRAFEWIVLAMAVVHAGLALHGEVSASERSDRLKATFDSIIFVVAFVLIGTATVVVLTYR